MTSPSRTLTQTGTIAAAAFAASAFCVGACGGRADGWSAPTGGTQVVGLARSVALVDVPAQRIVQLVAGPGGALALRHAATRRDVVAAVPSPSGDKLYVLTAGHRAALGDPIPDEPPLLTVFDDGPADQVEIDLGLTDPLDGLTVDPAGRWAVVYAAGKRPPALVTNPNELVILDLASATARHHTIHSFGGRPERIVITRALSLPQGPSALLMVQAQQQLALLPLDGGAAGNADVGAAAEITVRLAGPTDVNPPPPADIVVDDGDAADTGDARVAIRFQNDRNVMMLQLGPAPAGGAGFLPSVNVADAGGVPSDIAFVRTDGGLRLAALVPATGQTVLVDPVTTTTTPIALPVAYQRLSLVTAGAVAGGGAGADVALLWQGSAAAGGVAFWELGQAAGRPFRSIETVAVAEPIGDVLDVPLPGAAVKILAGKQAFYVLDLVARTAAPLVTSVPGTRLVVSPTGERVWTFRAAGTELAATDIASKQVRTLRADTAIDAVFEIANTGGDGRSLIALHQTGAFGATVYDADAPDDSGRRIYGALLLEGPYAN